MDDLMTCAICLDRFTAPKVLPCQHTFCLRPCLEGLVSNGRIKCPECRAVHKVPSQGVSGFPNNLTMIKLMDTPHKVSRPSCEECKAKNVISGLCIHCNKSLCHRCLLKHTNTLKDQLQDSVSKISQKSSNVSRKVSQVEQMQKRLKDNEEKIVTTIEKWYHSCLSKLQSKKSKFLQSIKTFINEESRVLQDKRERLEVELALMKSFCENANKNGKRASNSVSIDEMQTPLLEMIRESKGLLETSVAEIKTEKFAKFSDDKASNITQTISEFNGVEIQDRPVSLVRKKAALCEVISAYKQFGFGEDQPTTSGLMQRERNLAIATSAKGTTANDADILMVEDKQPPGQMILKELRTALPGYENTLLNDTQEITYKFPQGCMNGIKYKSTEFKAYVPHSPPLGDGIVSAWLRKAFDAGEVFRLQYRLGEKTGQIIWGDIPHKTSMTGGPKNNGYPDDGYWNRLSAVLRAKGFAFRIS